MSADFTLRPIGIVKNSVIEPPGADYDLWESTVSEITIDASLTDALDGLEKFSHVIILYWMHKTDRAHFRLKVHPRGRSELPLMGLFATRTPNRPNPIGKATVRLLEQRGNVLRVRGLDAIDGTPVLDIKPFIPPYDYAADARIPEWSGKP